MFIWAFLHFFISFEYDFHVNAERMIVLTHLAYRANGNKLWYIAQ